MIIRTFATLLVCSACIGGAFAESEWIASSEDAVFAVVTRKGGLAAGLAHDHLISVDISASTQPTVALGDDPEVWEFELTFPVESLRVDDPSLQQEHQVRLIELGVLEDEFSPLSDKNRAKIRKAMLGKKQLNAANYPTARVDLISANCFQWEPTLDCTLEVRMRIGGGDTVVEVELTSEDESDSSRLTAVGEMNFTDLGIKPYSAALGAVRNQDRFFVFLQMSVERPAAEEND